LCLLPCLSFASLAQQATSVPLPAVYSLAFSVDGKKLAVGTHKQALLYDATTWTLAETFTCVHNTVRSLAFHPDGKHLLIGSGDTGISGNLVICDLTEPGQVLNYTPAGDTIEAIAFSKDGASMLTASLDSKARFYANTFYRYGEQKLEEHNGRVTSVAFSPKPNYIYITGAMDKMVKVWDFKTGKVVVNFDQATAGITGLGFLANGDQFVGASMDGNLYWWGVGYNQRKKIYSGYPIRTIRAHEDGVTAFSISADHARIATGGMDHTVRIWKADDGGRVREFKEPAAPIYCTALSPDGKIAAAAGREGVVWVWDVEANKLLKTLIPPRAPREDVAAVPNSSISDGSVRSVGSDRSRSGKPTPTKSERAAHGPTHTATRAKTPRSAGSHSLAAASR